MSNNLIEDVLRIKSLINEVDYSSTLLKHNGSEVKPSWNSGPSSHAGKDWQSKNAYDIPASIGTKVYSISSGTVRKVYDSGSSIKKLPGKKIYGTQVSITSDDGNPDLFYTHLKNVKVTTGDKVKCGQELGEIMDFPGSSYDHVHIGAEYGQDVKSLMDYDGKLKCKNPLTGSKGEKSFLERLFSGDYLKSFKQMFTSTKTMDDRSFIDKIKGIFDIFDS
jgi:murein DD-endopeptidase MepM/ murein hydrolase activator NlpD